MFDKEAIQEISQSQTVAAIAAAAAAALATGLPVPAPQHFNLIDLEKYLPHRRRARGAMSTSVLADFASYTETHAEPGASVFINPDDMTVRAVLNLGSPETPGHADNLAALKLKRTAAYVALQQIASGAGQKQATVAEFLEDWSGCVNCFNGNDEITAPRAVAAVRKITIESMRKLESEERQLGAVRSALESVQASSGPDPLPTTIYFRCDPYQGLAQREFVLRLSILTGGDKPAIALRIVKQEEHNEEMADELAKLVRVALAGTDTPVYLGAYSAGQG